MLELVTQESLDAEPATDLLRGPWSCCSFEPDTMTRPDQLGVAGDWLTARVPSTVAAILNENGQWNIDHATDIDGTDWWFRTSFRAEPVLADAGSVRHGERCRICFDGLATLAEVWLNGQKILTSDNMFRMYRADVSSLLSDENELAIRFLSLQHAMKVKRPRPRWKTNLVPQQSLRWYRTSLQGHVPGWSPFAPAIGPWRAIRLESAPVVLNDVSLRSRLEGTSGIVTIDAQVLANSSPDRVTLRVGSESVGLDIQRVGDSYQVQGELRIEHPDLWWPHTHGVPALHDCKVIVAASGAEYRFTQPSVGFRSLSVDSGDGFGLSINGQSVYCRGACWTVSDPLTLTGTAESLERDLILARDAGINMLRVSGTMVYEQDRFYQLCNELGILVWQDFMFANMDYPVEDSAFHQNIVTEATQQLQRLAAYSCVAVYCGNSEIEQQAAMLGMPQELWRNAWFGEELPALCAEHHPGTAYFPSTPSGGVLPFQCSSGVTHYYGIGAYLRSPAELRQANVRFTPECLGFANVPDPATVELVTGGAAPATHSPKWKRAVPRDTGTGWDFEDVRDHYLRERYGVDPVALRSWNMPRYLQLSRAVSGEMMATAFHEWRGCHSENRGGLVWFYKDLVPGAGWGIIDSTSTPKAAYYYLKRTWSNRQLTLTDEGLNGLHLHVINETTQDCEGTLEVLLLKEPHVDTARHEISIRAAARSKQFHSADQILGGFHDVNYAYRFGPPQHDVVIATWYDTNRQVISEAYHFIGRREPLVRPVTLQSNIDQIGDAEFLVTLNSDSFLHGVRLSAKGYLPDDNHFHLPPERIKSVRFRSTERQGRPLRIDVEALNMETTRLQ